MTMLIFQSFSRAYCVAVSQSIRSLVLYYCDNMPVQDIAALAYLDGLLLWRH
jgi:hypothetical protein